MKVLVTGGGGFIGGHVVDTLNARGDTPVIFDRHTRGGEQILGDVRDPVAVTDAVAHCDAVIHLAGVLGTQETIANPRPAAEVNVLGSLNVFEAVAQYQIPAVYICVGNWWAQNGYSITKTCAERLALMYNVERDTTIAVVRAMNAYGPRQVPAAPYGPSKVRKIVPSFICRALAGDPIEIYGDGEQVADMVYVTDVACELVDAIGVKSASPMTVGTGRATTVNEIAAQVVKAVGGGEIVHLPMRPGEPAGATVLAPMVRPEFVTLEEGVALTVDWFR